MSELNAKLALAELKASEHNQLTENLAKANDEIRNLTASNTTLSAEMKATRLFPICSELSVAAPVLCRCARTIEPSRKTHSKSAMLDKLLKSLSKTSLFDQRLNRL
ncbi:hypothetical protein VCR3J2_310275 [Vibrio coralliirubri]|nr:hypothetical protein VCR3J2_310275 [Vibrio coralliirubri]